MEAEQMESLMRQLPVRRGEGRPAATAVAALAFLATLCTSAAAGVTDGRCSVKLNSEVDGAWEFQSGFVQYMSCALFFAYVLGHIVPWSRAWGCGRHRAPAATGCGRHRAWTGLGRGRHRARPGSDTLRVEMEFSPGSPRAGGRRMSAE